MRGLGTATVLAVLLAASGCGSGAGAHASDCDGGCWQPTPADETFLDQLCGLIEGCCIANAYRTAPNVDGCKRQFERAGISRDQSLRAACLAELQQLAGAAPDCMPEIWNLSDACVRVVYEPSGPQGPGQPCTAGADCAGAAGTITLCSPDPSSDNLSGSICVRLTRGKTGDRCLGLVTPNGTINAAAFYKATWTMPPISSGAVCERRSNLYCSFADDPAMQTCQPLIGDGASCAFSMYCASGQCPGGDSGNIGTCTPRVPAGQVCQDLSNRTICDDASYCVVSGSAGVCMAKLPPGSACNDDSLCASHNCVDNLCSAQTDSEHFSVFAFCAQI